MSLAALKLRLVKLENARDGGTRHHIFEARIGEDAERKQADLIASGIARPNDLFIVLRRFAFVDLAA